MISTIGKNILELRKQKGVTQEELAKTVGVTSQAVSKWEGGGTPDVELLVPIADYFGVSIDRLFGRNINDYGDIETEIAKWVVGDGKNKSMEKAFELCWAMQRGISGKTVMLPYDSLSSIQKKHKENVYSQMLCDKGITLMALNKELQYFLLMPEPESGWINELGDKEEYLKIFKILADPDILSTFYLLYSRDNKPFTPKLLEKSIGLSFDKTIEILDILVNYKLVNTTELEMDDEVLTIYNFRPNPAFIALLSLCKEMIRKPNLYYYYSENRHRRPYLSKPEN